MMQRTFRSRQRLHALDTRFRVVFVACITIDCRVCAYVPRQELNNPNITETDVLC
jgi:hypothetical protein